MTGRVPARLRLTIATVAAAGVAVAAVPAHAGGTKTLDGKKTKVLTWTASTTPQDHDTDAAMELAGNTPDFATCGPPECARFSFIYKPAKGVRKGPFSARISWKLPGEDMDLYVVEKGAIVGQCGAGVGTSELVIVDTPDAGQKYTIVAHEFRTAIDTVTAKAYFPNTNKMPTTVPTAAESIQKINCGLS
jgi:hypothetical protein